jgi:hypothetical protein
VTLKIAIPLALGGLLLAATACDGDDKSTAKGPSSTPTASATGPGTTAPGTTAPAASSTGGTASGAPRATPSDPEISNSRQIVMIDPDGKRYTFREMVQLAAGMRATMGGNAPSGFCATSYQEGVKGGGKFPAGREAFMAACRQGWALAAHPPR